MPIVIPDVVAERGKADAKRHRDKQREVIKKRLPEIISEESIITRKGKGKTVRVPIKGINIPIFRHGSNKKRIGGIGQGDGKSGDVIGRRSAQGSGRGKKGAGNEPGVDYIETEIEMEELVEMMIEDLGLPRLKEKDVREIVVEMGYRIRGTQRTGPQVLLKKRETAREGIKRFWQILRGLERETGKDELMCYRALKQVGGIAPEARDLLDNDAVTRDDKEVIPFPILESDDFRYHKIERDTDLHSRAVVFALMDVSYSMDTDKKYFARSMLYWLTEFLRKLYEHVEVRFIVHHTTARLVEEEDFFATGESGGTICASAYELVDNLIETEYPTSSWNVYVWHSSDGDDYDPEASSAMLRRLFARSINMFGFCEIQPGTKSHDGISGLFQSFRSAFGLTEAKEDDLNVHISDDKSFPFLGVVLRGKEDIHPAIKAFLKQDRWAEE